MISRRTTVAALMLAAVELALSACSAPTGRPSDAASSKGSSAMHTRHTYGRHRSQFGDLYLPNRDPGTAAVVVLLHGGYWQSQYGLDLMRPIAADIVARGHVVWNLEYRRVGTDGGGWPTTLADVAAGIDHLADPGLGLDLTRVVAVGHSAGGQLAAWAASRPGLPSSAPGADPRVPLTGVVSLAGVLDLRSGQKAGLGGGAVAQLLGGSPSTVPSRYADASPIERLPLHVPSRCVHSRTDALVPYSQSTGFVAAAEKAGDDSRLTGVPGDHFAYIEPGSAAWRTSASELEALLDRS